MIIFYDWDDLAKAFGPQHGKTDHTGIAEKVVDSFGWLKGMQQIVADGISILSWNL